MASSSSLLATSSPYAPSRPFPSHNKNDGCESVPPSDTPCIYSAQGDLVCNVKDAHIVGNHETSARRLQSSIGVQHPWMNNSSARYQVYDPSQWFQDVYGNKVDVPCCRCTCQRVGPCDSPIDVVKNPTATCSLCQSGACDRRC